MNQRDLSEILTDDLSNVDIAQKKMSEKELRRLFGEVFAGAAQIKNLVQTQKRNLFTGGVYINNKTFGASGIQLEYNNGTPRLYAGNGTDKYLQYDGAVLTLNGSIISSIALGSEPGIQGWQSDLVYSATDKDTVAWTAGTITLLDGTTYNISAGNTGNITELTFIYLDIHTSETVLQTTTTASAAVGGGKILLATCEDSTNYANYQVFGGAGGIYINGNRIEEHTISATQIVAGTITASEIAANTITANEIAAGAIGTDQLAANSVTAAKISVSQLSAISADMGTLTAGTITGATIRTGVSPNPRIEMTALLLAGYSDATTKEFYLDATTGKAYAGEGVVALDTTGVTITAPTLEKTDLQAYKFKYSTSILGGLYSYLSEENTILLQTNEYGDSPSTLMLSATRSDSGIGSYVILSASDTMYSGDITLQPDSVNIGVAATFDNSIIAGGNITSKQSSAAGIALSPNEATGNYTLSLSPANLTDNRRVTFPDADLTFSSGGTLDLNGNTFDVTTNSGTLAFGAASKTLTVNDSCTLAGTGTLTLTTNLTNQGAAGVLAWSGAYTMTVPATGTVAMLGVANVYTAANTFAISGTSGLNVSVINSTTGSATANYVFATQTNENANYLTGGDFRVIVYANTANCSVGTEATVAKARGYVRGKTSYTASITTLNTWQAISPYFYAAGGTETITNANGMKIQNHGAAGVTNAYGLNIDSQSGATNNYAILTNAGNIVFNEGGDANTDVRMEGDTYANLFMLDASVDRIGVNVAAGSIAGQLHIDQSSTTAAIPTLYLDQGDVDQPFITFKGTSAEDTSNSLVLTADGLLAAQIAYVRVKVVDDAGRISDAAYYVPLYTIAFT